jgi:hypothetical protein
MFEDGQVLLEYFEYRDCENKLIAYDRRDATFKSSNYKYRCVYAREICAQSLISPWS